MTGSKSTDRIELTIGTDLQAAITTTAKGVGDAVAQMIEAMERHAPNSSDGLLAALSSGRASVVAQIECLPAGPITVELIVDGGRRYRLGLLKNSTAPICGRCAPGSNDTLYGWTQRRTRERSSARR
jgi:hypothetical protein